MTDNVILWRTLQERLPKRTWMPIAEVYAVVEAHVNLDEEDLANARPSSLEPRWRSNVRHLLRQKIQRGTIRARKSG